MKRNNINIQDNFFDPPFLHTLQKELLVLEFKSRYHDRSTDGETNVYQRNYHQVKLNKNAPVVQELIKKMKMIQWILIV